MCPELGHMWVGTGEEDPASAFKRVPLTSAPASPLEASLEGALSFPQNSPEESDFLGSLS